MVPPNIEADYPVSWDLRKIPVVSHRRAAIVCGTNGVVMQQEFEASFTLFRYVIIADNGYTLIL